MPEHPHAIERRRRLSNYALLGLLSLLWGASFNFVKVAVQTIPPLTTVGLRVSIAAVILAAILRRAGVSLFAADYPWPRLFVQSCLMIIVPWTLSAWASRFLDSGLVTILNSTSPLFAFLITWGITHHEPATRGKLAGALAGLAGVLLIVGVGVLGGLGGEALPQLACVAGSVLFALGAVHGRRFDGLHALVPATVTLIFASIILLPLGLALDRPWNLSPSRASIVAVTCLAVFSTAAAVVVYYTILARMGSIAASSQGYLRIVVGVTFGIVFLGESLTLERALGMMLILAGVIAMTRPAGAVVDATPYR